MRDLILSLNEMNPDAIVKVKIEICRNWECYCEWQPIEDVEDYGDTVSLIGFDDC